MIRTQYGITQVKGCLFELMADYTAITEAVINALREDGMNDEKIKAHLQTAFENGVMFADGKKDEAMKRMTDSLVKELKKESERQ